jgi:hypothetical protein
MVLTQANNFQVMTNSKNYEATEQVSSNTASGHRLRQAGLDEMTPLQRQRLDAAVLMLVDYLMSASSS